jgi:tRNA threonylcarbamoyladenosine biosynthesis protein TsaE
VVWTVKTASAAETEALAAGLAPHLAAGDLLCLSGELGTGKTCFVRGLARGLGVTRPVTSPSFVLVHEYRGRLPLYHLDLYRLRGPEEAFDLEEYFHTGDAVVVVEWADRAAGMLPERRLDVFFSFADEDPDGRNVSFVARGERYATMVREWLEHVRAGH